jgi:ABC-type multidrug transport system ATPase subunit
MVEVEGLTKVFPTTEGGEKRAVDGLDFRVAAGEIYGLLGPNGAGKTTTLRMISGLISPTSGIARINGYEAGRDREGVKRSLGYLTASTGLYQRLTPREVLRYFGELIGLPPDRLQERIAVLIDWLGMASFADLRCGGLSTGQRQRTNIARALIGDPPVLVMDEPTLGLDVLTNRIVLDFIRSEGARGKAIILSTHYLDEAEIICHRFGLIHEGRLVGEGELADLQRRTGRRRLSEIFLALCGQEEHVLLGGPGGRWPEEPA